MAAPLLERTTVLDELGDLDAPPGSRAWAIAVRGKLREAIHDAEFSAQSLQAYRDAMKRYAGWKQLDDARGRPFGSFRDFCTAQPPFGLGYDEAALEQLRLERLSAQERATQPKLILDNRGPATAEERASISNNITNRQERRGTDPDYLTARIARHRPDILERMRAGEYPSVRAAALDAGFVKPRLSIPADVDGAARALRRHFAPADLAALCALLAEASAA